jgi:hypothetical protein
MAVFPALKHKARCLSNLEGKVGRDHAIGASADAVGTKILPSHTVTRPFIGMCFCASAALCARLLPERRLRSRIY